MVKVRDGVDVDIDPGVVLEGPVRTGALELGEVLDRLECSFREGERDQVDAI